MCSYDAISSLSGSGAHVSCHDESENRSSSPLSWTLFPDERDSQLSLGPVSKASEILAWGLGSAPVKSTPHVLYRLAGNDGGAGGFRAGVRLATEESGGPTRGAVEVDSRFGEMNELLTPHKGNIQTVGCGLPTSCFEMGHGRRCGPTGWLFPSMENEDPCY